MPNALKPHINPSTSSGVNAGRRGSRHSNNNSQGGSVFAGTAIQDSKAALRTGQAPLSSKSGLMAAGASTISASRLPGSKQASKQGFFSASG